MGQRTISTRIILEGDDEYRSKLSGIDNEIKTLTSNMKLVDSEFRGQANTIAALAAKQKALQDVYAAQKEKVATLSQALQSAKTQQAAYGSSVEAAKSKIAAAEAALEKLKNSTGDTTEEQKKLTAELTQYKSELEKAQRGEDAAGKAANTYQQKLNDAKIDLNKLDDELKQNDQYMDEAKRSTDQCAKSIDAYGNKTKEAAAGMSEAAEKGGLLGSIFKGGFFSNIASDAVSTLTSKIKEFATGALETADELERVKDESGFTTTELQKMQYVGDDLGVSLETQTGALRKLIKNMQSAQSGSGTAYDAFKRLNVAYEDGNGHLLDANEIYYKVITSLGKVTNETERDALALNLMGKSATDLNPLIIAGGDALEALGDEAEKSGAIMSEDAVEALDSFGDHMDHVKQSAQALVGEGLASIISGGKSTADQIRDLTDSFKQSNATLDLIAQYRQLKAEVGDLPADEAALSDAGAELDSVQQQLIQSSDGLISEFDLQRGTFSKQVDVFESYTKSQRDAIAAQLKTKIVEAGGAEAIEKRLATEQKLDDMHAKLTAATIDNTRVTNAQTDGHLEFASSLETSAGMIESYRKNIQQLNGDYAQQTEDATEAQSAAEQLVETYGSVDAAAIQCGLSVDDFNTILSNGTSEASGESGGAIADITISLDDLIAKYDEVKAAAMGALDSTVSGWTVMDNTAVTSAANANAALQSQIDWLTQYDANLKSLEGRQIPGVDMGPLIQSLSDGSTQSAAILAGLKNASDEDVRKIAENMARVDTLKQSVSGTMAEAKTNLSGNLDAMKAKMTETLAGMDMSSDAYKNAASTFQKYADGILSKKGACDAAASQVANSVQAILDRTHVTTPSTKHSAVKMFAAGTDFSPDMFIAGENGPELVMGRNGSKIWTAQQTAALLAQSQRMAANGMPGGVQTVNHTGVIRVEGVNSQGDLSAVTEIIVDQLRREARMN